MNERRITLYMSLTLLILSAAVPLLRGQTATSGLVRGTVTDATGGVVPGATVELAEVSTGFVQKQVTNEVGQYIFPNVKPGDYNLTITAAGFRAFRVERLRVEVTKSYQQDARLELGEVSETVTVEAETRIELQTVDATLGNVISVKALPALPIFTRQVNELLTIQPGSTPAGEVTGARRDQSTFSLDGLDVTNQSVGGTGTYMYLGVHSVEEFRVGVANPNASFGRAAGGQVALIGRKGTNELHGAAYWYHQNDNLNANTWDRNRTGLKKPELKDNRFGGRLGGPIWKDRTFFFANYEGRRFPRSTDIDRLVPTETLRQGVLRFRDAAGNVNSYKLATSTACGDGTQPGDPRGIGLSPAISALWAKMPAGNDPTGGDGLNTISLRGTVSNPQNNDFYMLRLDHNLSNNWRIDVSGRYFKQITQNATQLSLIGGNIQSMSQSPVRQDMVSLGLAGTIRPTLTADFRFGWVRNRGGVEPTRPNVAAQMLKITGTDSRDGLIALDLGARGGTYDLLAEPIDVATQVARKQSNNNRNYQTNADINWIKGPHAMQFGTHLRYLPTLHERDDKVFGSLGALVAQIDSDLGAVRLPTSVAPPVCGGAVTTNCILANDLQRWNRLYASVTGIIDNVSVMAVRDGNFKPLPYGSMLVSDTSKLWAPEFYFQDVWRLRPSLTLTLGVNYNFQTPPVEKLGRYTLQIEKETGAVIKAQEFLKKRRDAAARGEIYNPDFAFMPIRSSGTDKVFDIDWNNIGPRAAAAWNPSFTEGFLGRILGNRKTVIRGGYSLVYDRQNTVQSVIIPSLGIGFAQTLNVTTPPCNATGSGGPGCNPSSTNQALSLFRVGVDGPIPTPVVPEQTVPASPFWCRTGSSSCLFPEILSFQVDPSILVGKNHAFDLTVQRELPWNQLIEISYMGRYADHLPQSMNLGQAPYNFLDKTSGQTFAQAFDAVAIALRTGATVASQPWFENQVPGGTSYIASAAKASFINGNVNSLFLTIDQRRMSNGLAPFQNYMSQMFLLRSGTGRSNYHGMSISLRKRFSQGLVYDLSYTFSKSMDQLGDWQNAASVMPNSFDLDAEYGPSNFDITHIFNGWWVYEPPFRSGNRVFDKIVSGWQLSGIFRAQSGNPLVVIQGSQVWGGSLYLGFNSGAIPTTDVKQFGNSVRSNVSGSGNVGTTGDPAKKGTGLNLFADPEKVFNSFRRVELSRDGRAGRANPLRGLPRWNLDMSVARRIKVTESAALRFGFDFFNILNKVDFNNPTLNLSTPASFGVITSQYIPPDRTDGSRWIQVSFRVDF